MMILLAQVEVTVDNLSELVDATARVSGTDIVVAVSAIVSAALAAVLVYVTSQYTKSTKEIRAATDRMADASVAVIDEMRSDREIASRQRSEEAADRLAVAVTDLLYKGYPRSFHPESISRSTGEAWSAWSQAAMREIGGLRDEVLRAEVLRMSASLDSMYMRGMSYLLEAERQGRELEPPGERFAWLCRTLATQLGQHRSGESVNVLLLPHPDRLPEFWSLPPGTTDDEWAAFAEPPNGSSNVHT